MKAIALKSTRIDYLRSTPSTVDSPLELEAQFEKERLGRFEIVDNDEDVVHPFKRHTCGVKMKSSWVGAGVCAASLSDTPLRRVCALLLY